MGLTAAAAPSAGAANAFFGPGSVSWLVNREVILLAGGSRALLMQAAHPAVAAGVAQHSSYRHDPFGRLRRTLASSFAVGFGTSHEADRAIHRVNAIHWSVHGRIPETGTPYHALDGKALLWVHATLVDTALRVRERFVGPLTAAQAQRYLDESAPVAFALGVPRHSMPGTLTELRAWMAGMLASGEVRVTPTALQIAEKVLYPSSFPPRFVWELAHLISMSTLPAELRRAYGIAWSPARERGVDRLAAAARALLPFVPAPLRYVPQARAAERRQADL